MNGIGCSWFGGDVWQFAFKCTTLPSRAMRIGASVAKAELAVMSIGLAPGLQVVMRG